jgi:ADP-dependent phosphofructokinase/glucokinase
VFSPEIKFYHPQVILSKGDLSALNRVFKYRCGTAYLCHKHHFAGKYYKRMIMAYAASKLYYFTDKEKAKYYKTEFLALQLGKIFAEKY